MKGSTHLQCFVAFERLVVFHVSSKEAQTMVQISWDKSCSAYLLKASVVLPASRDELFAFFGDAFQLEQITPPWLNFRVLTAAPIEVSPGTLIDYRLKLRGIPVRWRTEIIHRSSIEGPVLSVGTFAHF
jgi:hypothetical protein